MMKGNVGRNHILGALSAMPMNLQFILKKVESFNQFCILSEDERMDCNGFMTEGREKL
jgi:hypothetical protein